MLFSPIYGASEKSCSALRDRLKQSKNLLKKVGEMNPPVPGVNAWASEKRPGGMDLWILNVRLKSRLRSTSLAKNEPRNDDVPPKRKELEDRVRYATRREKLRSPVRPLIVMDRNFSEDATGRSEFVNQFHANRAAGCAQ